MEAVVTMLNGPPFNYSITLMDLSQKNPQQLQEMLVCVMSNIHPMNPQNFDLDTIEGRIMWMLEALRIFDYRPNVDGLIFQQGLLHGNTSVIYPLLIWLHTQMDILKKRVHLAPFLIDIDIPPELLLEDDVNMLHTQFDVLRNQFKKTHRHLENARKKDQDPISLKANVQGLEVEKHHLSAKVQKLKANNLHVGNLGEFLDVIQSIQDQTTHESVLVQQLEEQEIGRDVSAKQAKVIASLHHTQDLANSHSVPLMLQKLGQTCSLLRYSAKDKLPKEMEIRQFHLQALQHVLSSSNNVDSGLSNIQAKLVLVKEEARGLKRMRHELHNAGSDGTAAYGGGREVQRQQVQMTTIVANKIRDALDTLASLSKHRDLLISQLQQKLHSIEEVKGSVRRGEDLKQYVEALRGKSATYKALKKELDDLAAENAVLVRAQHLLEHRLTITEHGAIIVAASGDDDDDLALHPDDDGSGTGELLEVIQRTQLMLAQQQQHTPVDEQLKLLESSITPTSCDVQDTQDVTQSKKVWQHISELDTKLQEQRAQVGPLSVQLRETQSTMQALESQYVQQETHFSETSLAYERKFANLEFCVNGSRTEIEDYNKQLHESTLHVERLEVVLDQLTRETDDNAVSEELQSRIELQEELLGSLHQKQQKLKESEQVNKAQMSMMKDLLTFLAAKLALYSSEMRPPIYSTNCALENGEDGD